MSKIETKQNNNILFSVIIALLIVIGVLAFFVGRNMGTGNTTVPNTENISSSTTGEGITVTVIDDKRCTNCQTASIVGQIKQVPFLAKADFVEKDFSDEGMEEYLKDNNLTKLPAIVFSTKDIGDGGTMSPYLTELPNKEYSLQVGASFDPFIKRSEKGFLVLDKTILESLKKDSHIKGVENAKVTWLEYTDLNCHYCQKMEKDGTVKEVLEKYSDDLNKATSNFIGVGGSKSQIGAELLECIAKIGGADAYNSVLSQALSEGKSSKDDILGFAKELSVDSSAVEKCFDDEETKDLVKTKFDAGKEIFGITGTPGNVLINNETGEYEIISGAYPASSFIETVGNLLK